MKKCWTCKWWGHNQNLILNGPSPYYHRKKVSHCECPGVLHNIRTEETALPSWIQPTWKNSFHPPMDFGCARHSNCPRKIAAYIKTLPKPI